MPYWANHIEELAKFYTKEAEKDSLQSQVHLNCLIINRHFLIALKIKDQNNSTIWFPNDATISQP